MALVLLFLILTAGWFIHPAEIEAVPLCLFKYCFHIDCPGCGLTRSFLSIASGNFTQAFHYNLAGPFVYLLFLYYFLELLFQKLHWIRSFAIPVWVSKFYGVLVGVSLFGQWLFKLPHQMQSFRFFH